MGGPAPVRVVGYYKLESRREKIPLIPSPTIVLVRSCPQLSKLLNFSTYQIAANFVKQNTDGCEKCLLLTYDHQLVDALSEIFLLRNQIVTNCRGRGGPTHILNNSKRCGPQKRAQSYGTGWVLGLVNIQI